MTRHVFITGTDTGVGKTVLTVLLTRHLRRRAVPVRAFKPLCSGGRDDAEALWAAQGGEVPLDAINPWHFRAAITPLMAARAEGRRVARASLLGHLRAEGRGAGLVLVEGAGGLLSPLMEDADARDLIRDLRAAPVIVAPDRLGVLNAVLLTWEALPASARRRAQVVLMRSARPDASTAGNATLLAERLGGEAVHRLPHLSPTSMDPAGRRPLPSAVERVLESLTAGWGISSERLPNPAGS